MRACTKRSLRQSGALKLCSARTVLLFLSPACAAACVVPIKKHWRCGCSGCWVSQPINWAQGDEAPLCSRARDQLHQTNQRKESGSRIKDQVSHPSNWGKRSEQTICSLLKQWWPNVLFCPIWGEANDNKSKWDEEILEQTRGVLTTR